jgi:hypothetical protein
MADWKRFVDIVVPEGLDESEIFDYIKNEVLSREEGKVFEYFIKEGLLRLNSNE